MNRMIAIALLMVSSTAIADWTLIGNGTAFAINENYVLTAAQVIEDCDGVTIRYQNNERDVEVAAVDSTNDLGLLLLKVPLKQFAKFRGGKPIGLGETVVNYGYRLFAELSDSAISSTGKIHSLSGWADDKRHIQYDAATEPGNNGGPVLDLSGNIVGIVSTRLGKEYADRTGNITQNVNFAVKSYVAEGFLSSNGVNFERVEAKRMPQTAYLAKKEAQTFTVSVGCWEGSDAPLVKPAETVNYLSGSVYVGHISADRRPHGQGTKTWSSGSKYTGEWIDGTVHGQGVYTWSSGQIYFGEWVDGKQDGHGTRTKSDGTKYVGGWNDGQRHGQGIWTQPNGEKYVGEYKYGKRNGQGTYTFPSGEKYVGQWKDDKYNGQGTYNFSNGEEFIGETKEGKFWKGVQFDQNGEPYGSYSNGVWKRISA